MAAALLAACGGPSPAPGPQVGRAVTGPASFGDNDPHDWIGSAPHHYDVHGIDVSKYQGDIDWPTVRASGGSFAFIKATEGGDVFDTRFLDNWRGAAAAGVPRGAYHYYYFCRTAAEQADWFIRNVPRDPSSLPPVLDMEWTHKSKTCRFRPSPFTVREEMANWLRQVGRHYDKRPVIYTTVDFYKDNELWNVKGYDFWLRSTAGHPAQVYPGQHWTFWQYTGTGAVPGIAGNTDINVFAGSHGQWRQWLAANTR